MPSDSLESKMLIFCSLEVFELSFELFIEADEEFFKSDEAIGAFEYILTNSVGFCFWQIYDSELVSLLTKVFYLLPFD